MSVARFDSHFSFPKAGARKNTVPLIVPLHSFISGATNRPIIFFLFLLSLGSLQTRVLGIRRPSPFPGKSPELPPLLSSFPPADN